jgi:hypothetical protein
LACRPGLVRASSGNRAEYVGTYSAQSIAGTTAPPSSLSSTHPHPGHPARTQRRRRRSPPWLPDHQERTWRPGPCEPDRCRAGDISQEVTDAKYGKARALRRFHTVTRLSKEFRHRSFQLTRGGICFGFNSTCEQMSQAVNNHGEDVLANWRCYRCSNYQGSDCSETVDKPGLFRDSRQASLFGPCVCWLPPPRPAFLQFALFVHWEDSALHSHISGQLEAERQSASVHLQKKGEFPVSSA